jgi:hypothetical protein
MGRIEKTVFISYRRTDAPWGLAVFENLTQRGYDVFIDYDGIASGKFEAVILENIRSRAHFLVLLTPTALERCFDAKDWMRREIEAALDSKRNIVPLMLGGFDFATPATANQLAGKLAALREYNGLEIPKINFFPSQMELLRNRFLNVPVDAVLHTASHSAQQVAKEQKDKATIGAHGFGLNALGDAVLHTAIGRLVGIPEVQDLRAVIGHVLESPEVKGLIERLGEPSKRIKHRECYIHLVERAGISLRFERFDTDRRLTSVLLYGHGTDGFTQYNGKLPRHLIFTDVRSQVERKCGLPLESGGGEYARYWARYDDFRVIYESTSVDDMSNKIHHIEILPSSG